MFISYIKLAIKEAKKALKHQDVPVGCVIVVNFSDGQSKKIIIKAHNKVMQTKDPSAHAEVLAIRKLSKILNTERFDDYDVSIYSTLEPCKMCATLIYYARIKKIYFSLKDPKFGGVVSNNASLNCDKFEYYEGFMQAEVETMMKEFFQNLR